MPQSFVLLKSQISHLGGLEKHALRILRSFREKGSKVTLLTTGAFPKDLPESGLDVVSHSLSSRLSVGKIREYDQFCNTYLASHPADIVFGMDRNCFQTHLRAGNGVHAAYLKQRKLFDPLWKQMSYSLNPLHRFLLKMEKKSFENPRLRLLFANSFMVKKELLEYYSLPEGKIEVIHNGVEWEEMRADFEKWQEKKPLNAHAFGLDPSLFHFLFIGHNYERKGLEKLLEALPLLPFKDFHLSVIGKEKNMEKFHALVQKLNLKKQVTFFGCLAKIRPFYQFCDALVIPSFYDPFANVTVEALAMGLFVVSSKFNGGHEILNEENGSIIDSLLDIDAIVAALSKAVKQPKTILSAKKIRASVEHLDFSLQLELLRSKCLA